MAKIHTKWHTLKVGKKTNPAKSAKVKEARGYAPEEIAVLGKLLDVLRNPNYPNQELEIYWFENYVWVVITGTNPSRFITAYKSRKLKKRYGK